MRANWLLRFSFLWSLLLVPASSACGQERAAQPLVLSLPQGGFASFKIKITPLNSRAGESENDAKARLPLDSQALADEGHVVHRLLMDEQGVFVFGYDLLIGPSGADKKFKVSARPLDRQFETRLRARSLDATRAPQQTPFNVSTLLSATGEQTVADGETFALDLLVNEQLNLKVVDYVKVATEKSRLFAPQGPRDFAVTNVALAVKNYQLRIGGETLRTTGARHSCTGALVWFSLPERGRFIFSLAPHEGYGFQKIGTMADKQISFTWQGARYEWISEEPIVGGGGEWNLWVLHDPDYVDVFAPPTINPEQESKLARVLRDPLGGVLEQRDDPKRRGLGTKENRPAHANERIRVRIGGADDIKALLPKR